MMMMMIDWLIDWLIDDDDERIAICHQFDDDDERIAICNQSLTNTQTRVYTAI
jgi:hypothetical protein